VDGRQELIGQVKAAPFERVGDQLLLSEEGTRSNVNLKVKAGIWP
jgi:hypothetical protein